MPARLTPFINDEYYHIFNRSIEKRPIFTDKYEYSRMLQTIDFYRYSNLPTKLSYFLKLANSERQKILNNIKQKYPQIVEIVCFVLMPNHFHLLIKQKTDNGISKFCKNISDSFTRYFNTRHDRKGPIFQGQFKAVRVESEKQLLHLSRYIHLNPFTAYLIKTLENLKTYPWSSLSQYLSKESGLCESKIILDSFKKKDSYWQFICDQANYQRELDNIKHLTFE